LRERKLKKGFKRGEKETSYEMTKEEFNKSRGGWKKREYKGFRKGLSVQKEKGGKG